MQDTKEVRAAYRVTIQEAARRLGVKEPAIRKRIERGTLEKERGEDGRVYVYVDEPAPEERDAGHDVGRDVSQPAGYDALISSQQRQIEFLQSELDKRTEEIRRRDILLANLVERVPQLEAPSESRESPVRLGPIDTPPSTSEEPHGAAERPLTEEEELRPSWWRRLFGF